MDWSLFFSVFITVFLAELGDKTQIATIALSGTTNRPLAVFIGSSAALIAASLLGALAGGSLATFVPDKTIKLLAAFGFCIIGLQLIWPSITQRSEQRVD